MNVPTTKQRSNIKYAESIKIRDYQCQIKSVSMAVSEITRHICCIITHLAYFIIYLIYSSARAQATQNLSILFSIHILV